MKEIIRAGDYVLHARITPLPVPAEHFSFELLSQQLNAKKPTELRQVTQFTCSRPALQVLVDQIQAAMDGSALEVGHA